MTLPVEARTFTGRLTSFERPVHLAKRRASSSTSTRKRNPTTVSWPHKFLDPIDVRHIALHINEFSEDTSANHTLCGSLPELVSSTNLPHLNMTT